MDKVEYLINEAERVGGQHDWLQLDAIAGDPRVVEFLIKTVSDVNGDSQQRIEALKVIRIQNYENVEVSRRIANTLCKVLLHDKDDIVRSYAAMASSHLLDDPHLLQVIKDIVFNPKGDGSIRASAFNAVMGMSNRPEAITILRELLNDSDYSKIARLYLEDLGS